MLDIVYYAIAIVGIVLAIPVLVFSLQVFMTLPRRPAERIPLGPRPRTAVLVPAHNEQLVIGATLTSILRQLTPRDRLVVIADNCSDHTAELAQELGAEVTVRTDRVLRGKGYALDHGLRYLEQTGIPDTVVFIDADCQLNDGCLDRLTRTSLETMRPVQATYLMIPPRPARPKASMIAFAWKVRDFVRPLGWHRLSLPCQLAGSGMAFPWTVVRATDLASSHLVEDVKQGLDLALMGRFALFCPEAVVTSPVITGGEPSNSQRARWEHGMMATIVQYLPLLLVRACRTGSLPLLGLALDLCIPPLAFLALLLGGYLALSLLVVLLSGATTALVIAGMTCILFFLAVCMAWWRHGQDILPLRWLVFAPIYALMKIPLYGRFFLARQREWVRGEREMRS